MDKIEIQHQQGISILKILGDIEGDDGFHILDMIRGSIEENLPFWIMDMPETRFMDSTALEVFLRILKDLKKRKGDLILTAITPELEEILNITRLSTKLKKYPNIDKAIEKIFQTQPGDK
ncbi:MAG: STAS domain-containing protein [Candidatus Margulisbacteria bacterium]|nr:STAS domain-containing protein [Candidatus Margulisiibacteriota bacterium]